MGRITRGIGRKGFARIWALAVVIGLVILFVESAHAATSVTPSPLFTINNPAPTSAGQFGFALSSAGTNVLINDRYRDSSEEGAAYLFSNTGGLLHTFANPTPSFGDHFGQFSGGRMQAVGVAGDLLILPDHGDDVTNQNSGSIHVYDAATYSFQRTISNPVPTSGGNFGIDIANIAGTDNLIVGADENPSPGRAFVMNARTGAQVASIPNPFPNNSDLFGTDVESVGSRIVVTAPQDDTAGSDAGAAYVFDAAGNYERSLFNPRSGGHGFGYGMVAAPASDLVAIGSLYDSTFALNAGSVHVFSTVDGSLVRTIDDPDPMAGDVFGIQLAFIQNDLLVAAMGRDVNGVDSAGVVYRFDILTGDLLATYANPNPHVSDFFGYGMISTDDRLYIGAPGELNPEPGTVYAYSLQVPEPSCGLLAICAFLARVRRRKNGKGTSRISR